MKRKQTVRLFGLLLTIVMLFGFAPTAFAADYDDVSDGAWYRTAVDYVTGHNLMAGTGGGNFEPETPMTRAMMVTVLHRIEGTPPVSGNGGFSDVSDSSYYTTAVAWAAANQIVAGIDGRFEPYAPLTREQFATILYRYADVKNYETSAVAAFASYTDALQISAFAETAMHWAVGRQIIQGSGSRLRPLGSVTRAQAALMFMRFMENITEEEPSESNSAGESIATEFSPTTEPEHGPALADISVKITSQGHTATFQLYDTVAAKELYEQLPLELELTNFRDAQWMFYPPQKLNVTEQEAYHDGKKGELSYYKPWGDVFLLYEDFYAGDEMHRLGVCRTGIDGIADMSGSVRIEKDESNQAEEEIKMQISIQANGNITVFELNDSQAAKELYAQLPLTIAVENYSTNEKIFYPPKKLAATKTPLADARLGTLAYYAPWGDVVMFYGSFGSASGLYELGNAVSGGEHIENMSGMIRIAKMESDELPEE
ncbi:MAG: cyclophilin-like fold protein [Peptococcaceae bacterium]